MHLPRAFRTGIVTLTALLGLATVSPTASATAVGPAHYTFKALHSWKCMDVAGQSQNHAANVHQWTCGGYASQEWELRGPLDDTSFVIVNKNSQKCLDVAWAGTHDGADVIQATCTYANNQRWWINDHPIDGAGPQPIIAKHSGKCLDVAWADHSDGANIVQSGCWNGSNQLWRLERGYTSP